MIWKFISWIITRRAIFRWLQRRGWRTPYSHIGPEGNYYMMRFWLFNPYGKDEEGKVTPPRRPRLPSIRLHWIRRPDQDRHLHDHPWARARTIVCLGSYEEERRADIATIQSSGKPFQGKWYGGDDVRNTYRRNAGYTGELRLGEYHRISAVSDGGVWTCFITWGPSHGWGFLVNGRKIPWREYLKVNDV